jgi:hypothetical protein
MDRFTEDACLISKEMQPLSEFDLHISDAETICSSCSQWDFSLNYEQEMDSQLEKFAFDIIQEPERAKKKRGRKPLRPNDPIQKKTEIKDKYWFRAFRNFIKIHLAKVKNLLDDQSLRFWTLYTSKAGKPGKESNFLSYGRSYKSFLYSEVTFASVFKAWFVEYGAAELQKKYEPESDLWFIYYDYASKEIARDGCNFQVFREIFQKRVKVSEGTRRTAVFLINN